MEIKIKEVQNEIEKFKYNIESGKNKNIPTLEKLGIDHIIVDESHKFKNASFSTRHNRIKGIGKTDGTGRADVLRYAIRTIQKKIIVILELLFLVELLFQMPYQNCIFYKIFLPQDS